MAGKRFEARSSSAAKHASRALIEDMAVMSMQVGGHVVLVRFRTKSGHERDFARRIQTVVPETRTEPGNRQFEFYFDQDDPLNFMLYEEFADEEALQAHRARPSMIAVVDAIKPMLEHPPDASAWTLALTNAKSNHQGPLQAGHVTLVRFRMKRDCVEPMLEAMGGDLDGMQGNIRFDVNRDARDPLEFMICARWATRAVWEAHNAKPEFKAFAARTASFLDTPMQRTLWRPTAV